MRRAEFALLLLMLFAADVQAQTPSAGSSDAARTYVEGVAQSAFGNVTSQSYGVEAGTAVKPRVQVFVEMGRVADVATTDLGTSARLIATALAEVKSNVTFSVAEPVTFFAGGVKYLIPTSGKLKPYVLAGAGLGRVKQDVSFKVGDTDVTANLDQFGIVLGGDLSGSFTKLMLTGGAGVTYPIRGQFFADFQFRYSRILAEGASIPIGRAGLGLGIRF